eukprot:1879108-Pyramimonas_sp.AAC.1
MPQNPDSEETCSEVVGRWLREAMLDIRGGEFWLNLGVASAAKKPILHVSHWLQQQALHATKYRADHGGLPP